MGIDQIIARFKERGIQCRWTGTEWRCQCPAHAGKDLNLALAPGRNGGVVVTCFSHECGVHEVAPSVGLTVADFMPPEQPNGGGRHEEPEAVYPYRDEKGEVLFEVVRERDKRFWQRLPGGSKGIGNARRVLFGLPELLRTAPKAVVAIVEGEKDAIAVAKCGIAATTNPHGALHWKQEFTDWLKGHLPDRHFVILADNDEKGERHAEEVYQSLKRAGLDVRIVRLPGLPDKGDVSDWLRSGGTAEELRELTEPEPHPLLIRLLSREALRNLPPPIWQVDGFFYEQSIVEMYGESNHGKSLVGVDLALSIVRGGAWAERLILKPGPVLYVNADGGPGFSDRLRAWELANGMDAHHEFWTYPQELLLASPTEMHEFTEGLAHLPAPPVLVVIDTLSQCIPGVNENQQEDMSRVIAHLNAIKRRYGCTVMLLHHVGKDGLNRGSTVIPGAADTIVRVTQVPGNLIELRCDKQRDGRKFEPFYFSIEEHADDEGVYLVPAAAPAYQAAITDRDEREQQVVNALRNSGAWLSRDEVRARTIGLSAASVYRYLKKLVEEGVVMEEDHQAPFGAPKKIYLYRSEEE